MVMKSCGMMPMAPLRCLGESSPRYMGTTLDDRPADGKRWMSEIQKRLRLRNPRRRHACSWNDSIWPAQIPTINLATMMISYDLAISLTPIITAGTMEKMLLKRRVPFLLQGQCMWSRIRPTRKTCFYSRWGQTVCITSLVCWPEEPPSESQRSLPAGTWTRTETTAESKSSPPLADHCAPCRFHYRTAAWTKETRTTAIKKTTSSHHWHCVLQ